MSDYSHLRSSFWRGTSISTRIPFTPHGVTTQRHLASLNREVASSLQVTTQSPSLSSEDEET